MGGASRGLDRLLTLERGTCKEALDDVGDNTPGRDGMEEKDDGLCGG